MHRSVKLCADGIVDLSVEGVSWFVGLDDLQHVVGAGTCRWRTPPRRPILIRHGPCGSLELVYQRAQQYSGWANQWEIDGIEQNRNVCVVHGRHTDILQKDSLHINQPQGPRETLRYEESNNKHAARI